MEQYKLIKEFPGSRTLGAIADTNEYSKLYFTNYPEFWEPMPEKKRVYIVKIVKCKAENGWYRDKIGHNYIVIDQTPLYYVIIGARFCTEQLEILNAFLPSQYMLYKEDVEILSTVEV